MALVAAPVPALSQGASTSEGEKFLKAIEERDNNTAIPLLEEPGSRVVNYRGNKGDTALHIATRNREPRGFAICSRRAPIRISVTPKGTRR